MMRTPFNYYLLVILLISLFMLNACSKSKSASLDLSPVTYSQLPNWDKDQLTEAWPAFIRSCLKLNTDKSIADWRKVCGLSVALKNPSEIKIREFFETYFTPYIASSGGSKNGLFTGYYEPLLRGSRTRTKQFNAPLYKRPSDLIMVEDLGIFNEELKGVRIAGRLVNGNLIPYYTHAEIDSGILAGNEIMWLEDPIDAFFIQIQGSAAIKLDDGKLIHLTYAGTNGQPYTAIGKVLIDNKALTPKNISMQSIRAWLKDHPDQAEAVLNQNASFVFFKESQEAGPINNQDVILTPGRSLAVDPVYISYGTPIWLDIENPTSGQRIQRLVIAQDKGGAIKGPIRGDLFWGTGNKAGEMAGLMKSSGSYYVLLPTVKN